MDPLDLRVLLYQEEGCWIAQGVDYDVNAQGRSIQEAQRALIKTLICTFCVNLDHGRDPLDGVSEAPPQFKARYEAGEALVEPASFELPANMPLPAPHVIRAVERRIET